MQNSIIELKVYSAHTGKMLTTNPYIFSNIQEFKDWVAEQFDIPLDSLLLLTPQGLKVKESVFHHAGEIFAFNKAANIKDQYNVANNNPGIIKEVEKSPYDFNNDVQIDKKNGNMEPERDIFYENSEVIRPIQSPLLDFNIQENQTDYRQLLSIITTNASWSTAVLSDSVFSEKNIHEKIGEISNIFRSLGITGKYLDLHLSEISNKFSLSNDLIASLEKNSLSGSWENYYSGLQNIHLFNDKQGNLASIISYEEIDRNANESISLSNQLGKKVTVIQTKLDSVRSERSTLEKKIEIFKQNSIIKNFNNLNLNDIVKQIKNLSKLLQQETKECIEIFPEYQTFTSEISIPKEQLSKLLKTISRHQQVYVPETLQLANDLYYLQLNLNALYKKLKITICEVVSKTNSIQANLADVRFGMKSMIKQIDDLQVIESNICTVIDLPLLYGIFLLENVRRIEWDKELKNIVGKTAENFSLINEKEVRLRKKWEKNYGLILKLLKLDNVFTLHNLSTVDLTTNKDETIKGLTLNVTRQDVADYISNLKDNNISEEAITILKNSLRDLNNQKVSLYSKFDGYLNFQISKDSNATDNELIQSYQTRIKKLESILHQHKYKNLNQWPLIFPQTAGGNGAAEHSRSRSPSNHNKREHHAQNTSSHDIMNKLNITSQRSLSTTSLNRVSTVTTVEKKSSPKVNNRKQSFGGMFGIKQRKASLLLNNGNIELTNSIVLLTENDNTQNRIMVNNDPSSPSSGKNNRSYSLGEESVKSDEADLDTEYIRVKTSEWNTLKNKNNELFVQNSDLLAENQKNNEEIKLLKQKSNNLVQELEGQNIQLKKCSEQENLINRLNNENSDLNQEIDDIVGKLKATQFELDTKTEKVSENFKIIDKLKKALSEAANNLERQKEQSSAIKNDLLSTKKELHEIHQKSDKSENRLKILSRDFEKATEKVNSLKEQNIDHVNMIQSLEADLVKHQDQLKNANVADSRAEIELLEKQIAQKNEEITAVNENFQKLKVEFQDIGSVKNDLLANMHAKEEEFSRERNSTSKEISELKAKVEGLEDNEDILDNLNKELALKNSNLVNIVIKLIDIISNFRTKLHELSSLLFDNFKLICSCFEAIGLLITKNDLIPDSVLLSNDIVKLGESFIGKDSDKGIRILRVKGLRNKTKSKEDLIYSKPVSPLIQVVENKIDWIGCKEIFEIDGDDFSKHEGAATNENGILNMVSSSVVDIDRIVNEATSLIENFNNNADFEKNYFNFITSIVVDYNLIYTSMAKRFGDIEHLAKKLQKETKSNKEEIRKLLGDSRGKIAVKNFKPGDLVLFLPTRDGDTSKDDGENNSTINQPWAAFNIGSPHYFLKENNNINLNSRDWMVSRILSINEFRINSKNFDDLEENPFRLSQGVTWYLIDAKEELSDSLT
ncbi:autophagy protein [Saccharomycopsis crataegensis]|uniref:Autophagy-related protein 11 n=1 Tax=Saccharomycopsis crataegensis TaxID=43959 RepID=A0AAV5QM06_9ASCO|nr:autophagy protein [Saccharomycopsis crataegensis]